MRAPRARRSCHVVPGSSARMLEKAAGLAADEMILDLEDSVAPGAKSELARDAVATALRAGMRAPCVAVRVNAVDTPYCHRDLVSVVVGAGAAVDVVVLPKVDDPGQISFADHLLSALEQEVGLPRRSIGLEAQIETAAGLACVEAIASACPERMEALVFGPGDMAASLGMPQTTIGGPAPGYPGDVWHHVLGRILVAARANGLQAIDGPYAVLADPEGLAASAGRSRALGYDGKWSIHPDQVEILDGVFGVSEGELARARRILGAHAAASAGGAGAGELDGEMIDDATRRMAELLVERSRRTGG